MPQGVTIPVSSLPQNKNARRTAGRGVRRDGAVSLRGRRIVNERGAGGEMPARPGVRFRGNDPNALLSGSASTTPSRLHYGRKIQ